MRERSGSIGAEIYLQIAKRLINFQPMKKYFGPSTLIAAAFVGPGTITTCTMAGVALSYNILWVMLLSIIATIILQEMSARLGLVTQKGLGEAVSTQFPKGLSRLLVFFVVIGAILIGNAAYEAGNISGGILGFELIIGRWRFWPIIIGIACFLLIYKGGYKWVEKTLIAMVIIMSICFFITAIIVRPSLSELIVGFIPSEVRKEDFLLAAALIGTTVVPYNLFLHASVTSTKWGRDSSLKDLRIENAVAVLLGGITSIFIIITAAGSSHLVSGVMNAKDLAVQLEPAFGEMAKVVMGLGLMAAGVSSAITAPLAAAYASEGLFGWKKDVDRRKFNAVWIIVLMIGVGISITDVERVLIIKFAQITNAILLPFVAGFLLYLCNSELIMKNFKNKRLTNIGGVAVVLITVMLSMRSLGLVFGLF